MSTFFFGGSEPELARKTQRAHFSGAKNTQDTISNLMNVDTSSSSAEAQAPPNTHTAPNNILAHDEGPTPSTSALVATNTNPPTATTEVEEEAHGAVPAPRTKRPQKTHFFAHARGDGEMKALLQTPHLLEAEGEIAKPSPAVTGTATATAEPPSVSAARGIKDKRKRRNSVLYEPKLDECTVVAKKLKGDSMGEYLSAPVEVAPVGVRAKKQPSIRIFNDHNKIGSNVGSLLSHAGIDASGDVDMAGSKENAVPKKPAVDNIFAPQSEVTKKPINHGEASRRLTTRNLNITGQ